MSGEPGLPPQWEAGAAAFAAQVPGRRPVAAVARPQVVAAAARAPVGLAHDRRPNVGRARGRSL